MTAIDFFQRGGVIFLVLYILIFAYNANSSTFSYFRYTWIKRLGNLCILSFCAAGVIWLAT